MVTQILRLPRVLESCGKGRSSHYADISIGLFTKPVHIGPRTVGWPANEVQAINLRLESVRSINEIKAGMRADARQLERKGISQEEHDRRQARAREKIRQIAERRNAKLGQAQGATAAP